MRKILRFFGNFIVALGCISSSMFVLDTIILPVGIFIPALIVTSGLLYRWAKANGEVFVNMHFFQVLAWVFLAALFAVAMMLEFDFLWSFILLFSLGFIVHHLLLKPGKEITFGRIMDIIGPLIMSIIPLLVYKFQGLNHFFSLLGLDTNLILDSVLSKLLLIIMFVTSLAASSTLANGYNEQWFAKLSRKISKILAHGLDFSWTKCDQHKISFLHVIFALVLTSVLVPVIIFCKLPSLLSGLGYASYALPIALLFFVPYFASWFCSMSLWLWDGFKSFVSVPTDELGQQDDLSKTQGKQLDERVSRHSTRSSYSV